MRRRWIVVLVIPTVIAFGASFWLSWQSGEGRWHERCRQLWQGGKWVEIQALADNLYRTNRGDREVVFYGIVAAAENKDRKGMEAGINRLIEMKYLNYRWERRLRDFLRPITLADQLKLARSHLALLLLIMIVILNLASLKHVRLLPIPSVLSILLIVILFAV